MRRFVLAICAVACSCMSATAQQIEVETLKLDNGMEFLLYPRSEQPNIIAAGWMARVGSVNERPGITGISHFFEHMMFKGTNTIGTSNPEADRMYRESERRIRNQLLELQLGEHYERWRRGEIDDPWDQANDSPEMAALRQKLKDTMDEHRDVIVKDEFDRVYTEGGGSGMNAFTSHDVTFYFINVPSNKFELWAWMESNRLDDSVFREFFSERDVVHEERRLRTESTPTGVFQEQFDSMFWISSPYNWPVIGWTSDLNSYTLEEAQRYFDTYYQPGNLVGIIVGDFDVEEVRQVIESYFGRLQPGTTEVPPVVTLEMEQRAEIRMNAEVEAQPQIEVRYHTVPFNHADSFALEMMSQILNGRTGRLYKSMVEGAEIASFGRAGVDHRRYGGYFSFSGETKKEATPTDLEEAWYRELKVLQDELVSDYELQKVKNQVLADSYRALEQNFFIMLQLGYYEALGGWEYINEGPQKLRAVTPEDIQRVAKKYFEPTNRAVAIYLRKEGTSDMQAELAALDPQMRQMVIMQLKQLEGIDDVEALRQEVQMAEANRDRVPEEFRPAFDYIMNKTRERIEELEAEAGN